MAPPQSIVTGTTGAAGALAAGAAVGFGGLIAAPVIGVKKGGVFGGVAGLVAGVGALGIGVAAGAGGAAGSLIMGVVNTPGTIAAIIADDDLHGKDQVDLSAMAAEASAAYDTSREKVEKSSVEDPPEEYVPRADVKETALYDALGVAPDCSAAKVKRAYFKLALKEHPDKGGDPDKFATICDAYQVLYDGEKRRKYDEGGVAALKETHMSEPGVVFAMMFGEQQFDHLVGTLAVVLGEQIKEMGLEGKAAADEMRKAQQAREGKLAVLLAKRLDEWVSGDPAKFIKDALVEVDRLHVLHMGQPMLHSIGLEYEFSADRALGLKGSDWFGRKAQHHQLQTASKAVQSAVAMGQQSAAFEKLDDAEKEAAQAAFAEKMQDSLYNLMAMDIESTVAAAVDKCCSDTSVSKEVRRERAKGLLKLGKIFQGKLPGGES